MDVPINIAEATLGCEKEIPTLEGNIIVNIPSGSQTNDKLRVKGKGVPYINSSKKGDLYLVLDVVVPTKLDRSQKKLFEELIKTDLDNNDKIKRFNKYFKNR